MATKTALIDVNSYRVDPEKLKQLPEALRSGTCFICWKAEIVTTKDGVKVNKIPISAKNPSLRRLANGDLIGTAKSNDPSTWATLDECLKTLGEVPALTGVGRVLTGHDDVVCIDIDQIKTGKLKGQLIPQWREIIQKIDSYTELSPSGTGYHIWAKGARGLPADRAKNRRNIGLEMYDTGRYMTLTGLALSDAPRAVEDRAEAILEVYDEHMKRPERTKTSQTDAYAPKKLDDGEIIDLLRRTSGARFDDLFDRGEWSKYEEYPSQSEADLSLCTMIRRTGADEEQIDRIFRLSALMRPKWDEPHYKEPTLQKAMAAAPYADEIERPTDSGFAMRMQRLFGEKTLYCEAHGFVHFNGTIWEPDTTLEIDRLAHQTTMDIWQEARRTTDVDLRKSLVTRALKYESSRARRAGIDMLRSRVAVTDKLFDTNHFLFNTPGTAIVMNGSDITARPAAKEDYSTKMSRVEYDSSSVCPRWEKFLDEIFSENQSLIRFIQKSVGYTLTGDTREEVVFILYGSGSNGKSTFIETINLLMGDYSTRTPISTLLMRRSEGIPNDIARLRAARFVYAAESTEGRRLDEEMIKAISGGDTMVGRFLRKEFFEFKPSLKLWLSTNHKPLISGTDEGIWRRIRLIPFNIMFRDAADPNPGPRKDTELKVKLSEELSGILNWALEGYRMWRDEGLGNVKDVTDATKDYRTDMDVVGSFLETFFEPGVVVGETTMSAVVYHLYSQWCNDNGEYKLSQNALGRKLSERGFERGRDHDNGRVWKGLKPLPSAPTLKNN